MSLNHDRTAGPLPDERTIQRLISMCRLIYDRRLSDSAGGNISIREGELIYATPRSLAENPSMPSTGYYMLYVTLT